MNERECPLPASDDEDDTILDLRSKSISDRDYRLLQRYCPKCRGWHYEIFRVSGASFSRYFMGEGFSPEDFDCFVDSLDEALLETAANLFKDFYTRLTAKNTKIGIEADDSFAFRLLEYGRQRMAQLRKLGKLEALVATDSPRTRQDEAVRAAFELGVATAEHRLLDAWEDRLRDGIAMADWRQAGLPAARAERLRQGRNTRNAILKAARQLWKENPALIRNDSETARQIIALNLPELQKALGVSLGIDAITKHLRAARQAKQL
jgi:hypothetical protein